MAARLRIAAADHTIRDLHDRIAVFEWARRGIRRIGRHQQIPVREFLHSRSHAALDLLRAPRPLDAHQATQLSDPAVYLNLPPDRDCNFHLEQLFVAATIGPSALLAAVVEAAPVLSDYIQRNRHAWANDPRLPEFIPEAHAAYNFEVFNYFLAGFDLESITARLQHVDVSHCGFYLRIMRK